VACRVGLEAHWSVVVGHFDPVQNVPVNYFYIQEFQKSVKPCTIHRKLSVCQKNANDLSKCSEKLDLHFGIKIKHA
jgi:hypothetical protein